MIDTLTRPAPVAAEPSSRHRGEPLDELARGERVTLPSMDPKRARAIVERMAAIVAPLPVGN